MENAAQPAGTWLGRWYGPIHLKASLCTPFFVYPCVALPGAAAPLLTFTWLNVAVHYLEAGERETGQPTVMFLHGAKFSAADWQAAGTFDALAKLPMHAVAPDVPGFGQVFLRSCLAERAVGAGAHSLDWARAAQTGGAKLAKAAERLAFMVEFLDKLGIYQVSGGGRYMAIRAWPRVTLLLCGRCGLLDAAQEGAIERADVVGGH